MKPYIVTHWLASLNFTKALDIQERLFPGYHPSKASSYNNIGTIYYAMGDLNKSIEYFTKAFIRPYKWMAFWSRKDGTYFNISIICLGMVDF